MAEIDERVVEMKFRRDDFLKGTAETLSALERLDGSLSGSGGIAQNVERIGDRFSALGAVAFTALHRMGNAAVDAGMKAVRFVTDPLFEGGKKRALNIEQARFQFQGLGMDVDASMASALAAVKGTAYGLDEAAVVAAQFGASGMAAGDDMTNALRGISGIAAMAGSSYSDIGNVFTKVAGQGRLMGDDLNRLAVRGVNAAATLAKSMGITEEEVRSMVTKGKIDFQTFADAMSEAFGEHATKANETYTGSLSNLRAAIARIGASFASANFEKYRVIFNALTPVIDSIADALQPVVDAFVELSGIQAEGIANWLNDIQENFAWDALTSAIQAAVDVVMAARSAFLSFVEPVAAAFAAVFAPGDGGESWLRSLADVLQDIAAWVNSLKLTDDQATALQATLESFFSLIQSGYSNFVQPFVTIIVELAKVLMDLGGIVLSLLGPIGSFFGSLSFEGSGAKVGEWLRGIADSISELRTSGLKAFGEGLLALFGSGPAAAIEHFRNAFASLVDFVKGISFSFGDLFDFGGAGNVASDFGSFLEGLFSGITGFFGGLIDFLAPLGTAIRDLAVGAIEGLGNALKGMTPEQLVTWISSALNMGVLMSIKGMFDAVGGIIEGAGGMFSGLGGSLEGISESLNAFSGVLKGMQNDLNASALLKIAGAIAILAAAVYVMSKIDAGGLAGATIALGVLAGVMMGTLYLITKITGEYAAAKMIAIAVGLGILALAVLGFTAALAILSLIPMDRLIQGIIALAAILAIVVGAAALMSAIGPKMILTAIGLGIMAVAIGLLVVPILALAFIPMEALSQGLMGVGLALGILVAAAFLLSLISPKLLIVAPALMLLAIALNLLVVPIMALGMMDTEAMYQGLIGVSIALGALVAAAMLLSLVAPQMMIVAPALVLMAMALNLMVVPITVMAALPLDAMIQGLIGLAAALGILVLAAALMSGSIAGAVGIALVAAALIGLSVAISILAAIPIPGLVAALVALAVGLGILVGASALAMMVLPGMLALAGLMIAFAVAAMAIGAATLLFAAGAAILSAVLPALVDGLVKFTAWSPLIALATPLFLLIAAALVIFGAGALVAGVGVMVLAAGLMLFGLALPIIVTSAAAGGEALVAFVKAIEPLIWKLPQIGMIAAGLLALGAALLVLATGMLLAGVGAVVLGAGALVAAVGLAALLALAGVVAAVAPKIAAGFATLGSATPALVGFASAVVIVASGLSAFNASARNVLSSISMITAGLGNMTAGFMKAASASSRASTMVSKAMTEMGSALRMGAALITSGSTAIVSAFTALARGIVSTGPIAASAATSVINQIVSALTRGAGLIAIGIALITTAFQSLGRTITAAGAISIAATTVMMNGIQSAVTSGATRTAAAITLLLAAFARIAPGIRQNGSNVSRAVADVVSRIVSTLNNSRSAVSTAGYAVGVAMGTGMINGLNSQRSRIAAQASNMATQALNAAKNALEVRSPSGKFREVGNFAVDGFLLPFRDRMSEAGNASADMGNSMLDAMDSALRDMETQFADMDQWGMSPVITPVLDLDQARRQMRGLQGFGSISGDFGRSQASSLALLDEALRKGVAEQKEDSVRKIEFIQNNHSPKALSEAEIYRRTRNLISGIERRDY